MSSFPPYATIEKYIGETPLEASKRLRENLHIPKNIPLAYAGRLDPMASGTLLMLIGDECKRQTEYHSLDKTYTFEILFGAQSDTGDVLGLVQPCSTDTGIAAHALQKTLRTLCGNIELSYPHFSSKTVNGKPLHTWTLEGRLSEIDIPTKQSTIYVLTLLELRTVSAKEVEAYVMEKIETPTTVTADSKKLGANFRRDDVRASWKTFFKTAEHTEFQIAGIRCTASSGTYMRSLAEEIAERFGTCGLAYSIHRTTIGRYQKIFGDVGFWRKKF